MMKPLLRKKISSHVFSVNGFFSGLTVLLIFTSKPVNKMYSSHTLLCLGDSYTIGESVLPAENFPNQTVQLLRHSDDEFTEPEIVAKTGWTTDELQDAIGQHPFKDSYDFVTLLIGVNNQYRGRTIEDYKPQFESLLKQAIQFANGKTGHVFVLSIPDWGVTPFAKTTGRDSQKIAREIEEYNDANKKISEEYKVNYIDITPGTKEASNDLSLIAFDGLHPSGKEYAKWAEKVSAIIKSQLN
ncbi:MAG: SGNH/GDSL hydrolase family protein [Chitinophagales bacterium]